MGSTPPAFRPDGTRFAPPTGVVLYRLCTGKPPFVGESTMDIMIALGTVDPTPVEAKRDGRTAAPVKPDAKGDDRKAVEYALSVGGAGRVEGEDRDFAAGAELPPGALRLTHPSINGSEQLTDAGLANFKDCKSIAYLELKSTQIGDAGLVTLAGLDGLRYLFLAETKGTAVGVAKLAKALPQCRIIWDGGTIEPAKKCNPPAERKNPRNPI